MTIQIGDKIPHATLMHMTEQGLRPITTEELFGQGLVALFGLPGAFTSTCSNQHLPGYVQASAQFQDKGVDRIICLSVNDAFVMGAWGAQQNVGDKVLMIADGNAELTDKLGLVMDGSGFGMGKRSVRYSMLVRDGVVEQLNIERDGAQAIDSGAENLLSQL